ncbi:MAG TPA: arylesterase [Povalibacter sp.]|nr:arylesterase [Povalibacter sp.]
MTVYRAYLRPVWAIWFAALLGWSIPAAAATAGKPVILVVGDSLSAGYGVAVDATWVALLQKRLAAQGYEYEVVNASVSGETTGGARTRLPRALQLHQPAIVILELGGNDGLRGLPLKQVRGNLETMLEQAHTAGAKSLLVGMRIPVNYGPAYTQGFHALYGELAKKFQTPLVGFFMERVALDSTLMQADGIHPNTQAQPILLDTLWPALAPLLKK